MELLELENIAKREEIDLINFKMRKTKAKIIEYNGTCIFMDYSKINTYTEEKCLFLDIFQTFAYNQTF